MVIGRSNISLIIILGIGLYVHLVRVNRTNCTCASPNAVHRALHLSALSYDLATPCY